MAILQPMSRKIGDHARTRPARRPAQGLLRDRGPLGGIAGGSNHSVISICRPTAPAVWPWSSEAPASPSSPMNCSGVGIFLFAAAALPASIENLLNHMDRFIGGKPD